MTGKRFRSFCLAAGLVLAAGSALAASPAEGDARVERMTDAMVQLVPLGRVFDTLAVADPVWPSQGMEDQISVAELRCARDELSSAGYRRYVRNRVQEHVQAHPERFDLEIETLEGGAAELFGKLIIAGAEGERTGVEVDPEVVLEGATADQMVAFMTFFSDPEFAGLRKLAGIGESLGQAKDAESSEKAGEQAGNDLAATVMLNALQACGIELPTSDGNS